MTPYHEYFVPIFLGGCFIATTLSFFAGRSSGCLLPGILLGIGVVAFWVAMFLGADFGYRAWQAMPDPPDEAFSDASVVGALVFGWLPSGVFCLTVFGLTRGFSWLLHWANPHAFTKEVDLGRARVNAPVETGNPYQGPKSGS